MQITPEYLSKLVNFYSNKVRPDWSFDRRGTDMRNLQVLGAAKAFNLMEKRRLALLSDEVGMGKTIQALSVCAALWNQQPGARILIFAPRDEVARNWEKEYMTFVSQHYRPQDNVVKAAIGGAPIYPMRYCQNLYELVGQVQQGWGHLFLCKISSLSSLLVADKEIERLEALGIRRLQKVNSFKGYASRKMDLNNEVASLLRKEILSHSKGDKPFFDLLIIDEAHYLRNKEGASLRVNTAKILFGDPADPESIPIAKRTLLLTATPNHRSSSDICNIVNYFSNDYSGAEYGQILHDLCIRRLRRLGQKALNKYNYRNEEILSSDFREDPLSEMFFGLYQHELAREVHQHKQEKKGNTGVTGIMKYLEGVEFLPSQNFQVQTANKGGDTDSNQQSDDFEKGRDAHMLRDLSRRFMDIYYREPAHPKYNKLVKELTEDLHGEKAVVFVRRIPSVREITKRVLEIYDGRYWSLLQQGRLQSLELKKLSRSRFSKFIQATDEEEGGEIITDRKEGGQLDDKIPTSRVLNLFKSIKRDPVPNTAATYFRSRFNHSKPGVFTLFFSPGADYYKMSYQGMHSYRYLTGSDRVENYYSSALRHRVSRIPDKASGKDILSRLLVRTQADEEFDIKPESIPTLLTIFWEVFESDEALDPLLKEEVRSIYINDFSIAVKEGFSNFLEKGTLLASEAVVYFFREFLAAQELYREHPIQLYLEFSKRVRNLLPQMRLYKQIIESIRNFRVIYTKEFSINSESALLEETWEQFGNAQPVYPYNADNSNQKVLKCFNTPFYPDILVATSVLQEGVNLQYFCNRVYHYGMAWTPGDNEQRIGRIDRMFGKIERLIDTTDTAMLNIYYPFLKDTVDEEQLARFVRRKYKEEALIDMGKSFQDNSEYQMEENEISGWTAFLRKPDLKSISDPYPVKHDEFSAIKPPVFQQVNAQCDHFYESIYSALSGLSDHRPELFTVSLGADKLILADSHLGNGRKQPVLIELIPDPIGTGFREEAIYCLRMRTPLASFSQYKKLRGAFYSNEKIMKHYLPGIKLCFDISQTTGSHWALYMTNELPLFIHDLEKNPLSKEEVQQAYLNLIHAADTVEFEIFDRDLRREELNLQLTEVLNTGTVSFRNAGKKKLGHDWREKEDFLLKQVKLPTNSVQDFERTSFIRNHENLFVKSFVLEKALFAEIAYLKVDIDIEEMELLEKHLDIFLRETSGQ